MAVLEEEGTDEFLGRRQLPVKLNRGRGRHHLRRQRLEGGDTRRGGGRAAGIKPLIR